jgi:hypothetical protein
MCAIRCTAIALTTLSADPDGMAPDTMGVPSGCVIVPQGDNKASSPADARAVKKAVDKGIKAATDNDNSVADVKVGNLLSEGAKAIDQGIKMSLEGETAVITGTRHN